jgi:hypothetical protein
MDFPERIPRNFPASFPPSSGTSLGSLLSHPMQTLKLTRGTGSSHVTFWKGYWTLMPQQAVFAGGCRAIWRGLPHHGPKPTRR